MDPLGFSHDSPVSGRNGTVGNLPLSLLIPFLPSTFLMDNDLGTTENGQLGRWQGKAENAIEENSRRLGRHDQALEKIRTDLAQMREDMAVLKTKVGIYAAIGSGLGSAVVYFLTSHIK